MKILSYNLEKHRAAAELEEVVESSEVQVVCLQEATVEDLPSSIAGLDLVVATENNRLGLAIYASRLWEIGASASEKFEKSLHDRIAAPAEERLLAVELRDPSSNAELVVASLHASPLTSLNSRRRRQILSGLASLEALGDATPLLMAGDFNYPIFRKHLEQVLQWEGYSLTFANDRTYSRGPVRGHFDFVASRDLLIERVSTLPRGASDHRPILVEAQVTDVTPIKLNRTRTRAA